MLQIGGEKLQEIVIVIVSNIMETERNAYHHLISGNIHTVSVILIVLIIEAH